MKTMLGQAALAIVVRLQEQAKEQAEADVRLGRVNDAIVNLCRAHVRARLCGVPVPGHEERSGSVPM
jgi:hypothetical protein